jgi:hypothetical protein
MTRRSPAGSQKRKPKLLGLKLEADQRTDAGQSREGDKAELLPERSGQVLRAHRCGSHLLTRYRAFPWVLRRVCHPPSDYVRFSL